MSRKVIMRGLAFIAVLLLIGTIFYSSVEKLSLVDAFYFSGVTLTTLGYGDIVPTTDASKIFTVLYALTGMALMFYLFTKLFHVIFTKAYIQTGKKRKN